MKTQPSADPVNRHAISAESRPAEASPRPAPATGRGRNAPPHPVSSDNRSLLLASIPATERRYEFAGIPTAVLEAGAGPPVVLLHGIGENVTWWMRVIPKLAQTNRVIVPDLPGHGASRISGDLPDEDRVLSWLGELIARTCAAPPTLVGHLIGGSIAARYAIGRSDADDIGHLVLVDSFGLSKFRPAPSFAFRLIRFMMRPTERTYDKFLPHCMYDAEDLKTQMGPRWKPFLDYNLELAREADCKAAMKHLMRTVGTPQIPASQLKQIDVPTSLIWGRHDRAYRLRIAEKASEHYGWPLHVIDQSRDDPKLERPQQFLRALRTIATTHHTN